MCVVASASPSVTRSTSSLRVSYGSSSTVLVGDGLSGAKYGLLYLTAKVNYFIHTRDEENTMIIT